MSDIDLHLLNNTIADFESKSTNRKINVASDANEFGFRPFMWNSGGYKYQTAAIDENARFEQLSTLGKFGLGMIPESGTGWDDKMSLEASLYPSMEKFSIASVAPYISQCAGNVIMTNESTWKFTENTPTYPPIMMMMGRTSFSIAYGITGVKDATFNVGNLTYPIAITQTGFNVFNNSLYVTNDNKMGIGVVPTDTLCIAFPSNTIYIYDCFDLSESTPATTAMYLRYRCGASLYKIPAYLET